MLHHEDNDRAHKKGHNDRRPPPRRSQEQGPVEEIRHYLSAAAASVSDTGMAASISCTTLCSFVVGLSLRFASM